MEKIKYYQIVGDKGLDFLNVIPVNLSNKFLNKSNADKNLEKIKEKIKEEDFLNGISEWKGPVRNVRVEERELDIKFEDGKLIPALTIQCNYTTVHIEQATTHVGISAIPEPEPSCLVHDYVASTGDRLPVQVKITVNASE